MKNRRPLPPEPMTFARFVDEFYPLLREISRDLEMDFSFKDQAVVLHDMRTPSSIRRLPVIRQIDLDLPRAALTKLFVDRARAFIEGEQSRGTG